MRYIITFIIVIFTLNGFAQNEGQSFCDGNESESYFPLIKSKKFIVWGNTYYTEEQTGTKELNDKIYIEYKQTWQNETVEFLYLRKENGVIYQFEECCENETIRLPDNPKKGDSWKTADQSSTYKVIATDGELKTPICNYKNLLVLKSEFKNGSFTFYYLRGYGYIGATTDNLISFVTPKPIEN